MVLLVARIGTSGANTALVNKMRNHNLLRTGSRTRIACGYLGPIHRSEHVRRARGMNLVRAGISLNIFRRWTFECFALRPRNAEPIPHGVGTHQRNADLTYTHASTSGCVLLTRNDVATAPHNPSLYNDFSSRLIWREWTGWPISY